MSLAGNLTMGVLRIIGRLGNGEITDPEEYLAYAKEHNRKHPARRLNDHLSVYRYYRIEGCPVILIRSKKAVHRKGKAILYLHGGITNDWEAEVMVARGYANHMGMDVWYPLFPSVTQAAAQDIVEMIYRIYRKMTSKYGSSNIALIGTSFGGTFGFGLINRINESDKAEQPALYIANSPGGVPQTDEDWAEMEKMAKYDPLIHISAVKNIIPMQKLFSSSTEAVTAANSPAYGNFSEVPETYVYYAQETLAGNHLAYEKGYEKYGVREKLHMHIQSGMMHGYSCLPVFKESRDVYQEQIALLKKV